MATDALTQKGLLKFPEVYNANMKEIEKAITAIMFEIAKMKDDIAHLKIMIRED